MSKRALALALCCALPACASAPAARALPRAEPGIALERSFRLMGTTFGVTIAAPTREAAIAAADAARLAVARAEARLSTWTPESELSALNSAPTGRPLRISPSLARDLRSVHAIARETDGAFSPWLGPLVEAWGLREAESVRRAPSAARLARARAAARPEAFHLDPSGAPDTIVRRLPGARYEEGGFGKGIGLDDAVAELRDRPELIGAVLDFGGQVSVLGRFPAEIRVAHPRRRDEPALILTLPPTFAANGGSISTSGISEHGHHILDPRTGAPAAFDGSVTVLAPTGVEADALSTALFAMGPERGARWANARGKQALWLVPLPDGLAAVASCAWSAELRPSPTGPAEGAKRPLGIRRICEPSAAGTAPAHPQENLHAS